MLTGLPIFYLYAPFPQPLHSFHILSLLPPLFTPSREMAMAKFLVLLAVALLAIMMAESSMALAKGVEHVGGEYHLDRSGYGPGSLRSYQCGGQCSRRCSKTQYKKPCLFFCNKCCAKCLCVPPGFYGNKGVCPCYNNWKTKEGGPKCP